MKDLLKLLLSLLVISSVGCDRKSDNSNATGNAVKAVDSGDSPNAASKQTTVDDAQAVKASWQKHYRSIQEAVELYTTSREKAFPGRERNVAIVSTDIKKTDSILSPYKAIVIINDSNEFGTARLNLDYSLENGIWKMSDATHTVVSSTNPTYKSGVTKPLDWKSPSKGQGFLIDYMPK